MPHTVEYFMWGYQEHFQISAQVDAQSLFRRLDPGFEVRVHVVGFLVQKREDRHPICVVPDDCPYQPSVFHAVPDRARELGQYDPRKHGIHTHPIAQGHLERRVELRGLVQAVQQAIGESCDRSQWVFFTSWPTEVNGYRVLVVLELAKAVYDRYYHLAKYEASGCWTTPFSVQRSLIEATASEFLEACGEQLSQPEPGGGSDVVKDCGELIRAAGKRMLDAPVLAGGRPDFLRGQYDACCTISTLRYEGVQCEGRLLYIDPKHPSLEIDVALKKAVPLRDYGAIRKLLELTSDDIALLCDATVVYGLGRVSHDYDEAREDVFEVRFERQFVWRLLHANKVLMHVRYGEPELRLPGFPVDRFNRDLPRIFPGIGAPSIERLLGLAQLVASQHHGAMLIISASAGEEAERLSNQCTWVNPFGLAEDFIPCVTSIDGGVLVDLNGVCHAIGVILDGVSHPKCTPARGARYNSAVRYVYHRGDCIAVVKSEDGTVSLLPELMPMIRRADVEEALSRLREYVGSTTVDRKEFYKTMDWLDEHRFYLSPDVCDEVNRLWPEAEKRLEQESFLRQYAQFVSSPEMNESYFFQE